MKNEKLLQYLRTQQMSLQWLPVLRAMALELSASVESEDLHDLFFSIGERFAHGVGERFEGVQTLEQLENSINEFWAEMHWGRVDLVESNGGIDIEHQAVPLADAFGDDMLDWSVGLLEGFYQTVFSVLGASDRLTVRAIGESQDGMDLHLRFSA